MSHIIAIAFKDMQLLLKDRGTVLQLFVLPLIFLLVFSGLGGVTIGEDRPVNLSLINLDEGALATNLVTRLEADPNVTLIFLTTTPDEATAALRDGRLARLLIIPADFSAQVIGGNPLNLDLQASSEANSTDSERVRLTIQQAAQAISLQTDVTAQLAQAAGSAGETLTEQLNTQWRETAERPTISVKRLRPGELEDPQAGLIPMGGPTVSVPGFTVLFIFLTAGITAYSIYEEKKTGTFRRLMAAPLGNATLLLGKALPTLLTALLQTAVIFLAGMFLLPLLGQQPLTLGNDLLALLIVILLVSICATGLGILIASLARTENQIGGGSALLLWVMGALGGAFIPTFLFQGFLGQIGQIVPHYWANRALYGLLARNQTLSGIMPELTALLAFTLLFWVIGIWRFRFE